MVNELKSDEEQGEALKKWLAENGWNLVTGVALGLAILFGGKAWFAYQENQAVSASHLYTRLMAAMEQEQPALMKQAADELLANHDGSPYAVFAALALAAQQIERGELAAAEAQLDWAQEHAGWPELRDIGRLRQARVLLAAGELDAAEDRLDQVVAVAFQPQVQELRGDIARERGDQAAAHAAYLSALEGLPDKTQPGYRRLLELKRDDTTPAPAEAS